MEPFSDSIGGYYRLMWFTSDQMWATVLGLHTGAFTGHSGMEAGDPASSSARASLAGDFRPHLRPSVSHPVLKLLGPGLQRTRVVQ